MEFPMTEPTDPRIAYPDSWDHASRAMLDALFEQARREKLWFFHGGLSGPLWFTPDELQAEQAKGNFVWGAPNWKLRSPFELLDQLERTRDEAIAAVTTHMAEMRKGLKPGDPLPSYTRTGP
jgi:hypothetical protein